MGYESLQSCNDHQGLHPSYSPEKSTSGSEHLSLQMERGEYVFHYVGSFFIMTFKQDPQTVTFISESSIPFSMFAAGETGQN